MTKVLILLFIALLTTIIFSCKESTQDKVDFIDTTVLFNARSMNDYGYSMDSLEKIVVEKGDIETYDILMIQLLDYKREEMIRVAKIMADKHHYVRAYTDIFQFITICDYSTLSCLTPEDRETAHKYLNLGLAKNDSLAIELKKEFKIK